MRRIFLKKLKVVLNNKRMSSLILSTLSLRSIHINQHHNNTVYLRQRHSYAASLTFTLHFLNTLLLPGLAHLVAALQNGMTILHRYRSLLFSLRSSDADMNVTVISELWSKYDVSHSCSSYHLMGKNT